jgi:hypothetical protein
MSDLRCYTAAGRAWREAVRLQAAEWFDQDVAVSEIAKRLRVGERGVSVAAAVSCGRRSRPRFEDPSDVDCRLSTEQQTSWPLRPVTLRGVPFLLHRMKFSPQKRVTHFDHPRRGPGRLAGKHRSQVRDLAVSRWLDCSASTPANEPTCSIGSRSTANARANATASPKPTTRPCSTPHQHLKALIVVIWDDLNIHISAAMRKLIAARDWLHIIQLPAYAPGPQSHRGRGTGQ